jgi:uncharacterized protein (TIGR02147 family)
VVIWGYLDYRQYLAARLKSASQARGAKTRLAKFIPIQTTYLSGVLSGRADLTLEQADRVNEYLQHNEEEAQFFLLLVQLARAGSVGLRKRLKNQILQIQKQKQNIKARLTDSTSISTEDRERFYSSYLYGAIHVLTSIPQFQKVEELANFLHLEQPLLREKLDFLERIGLLQRLANGGFAPSQSHVHLGNETSQIIKHHTHWRLHAVQHYQRRFSTEDTHYSGVMSLSAEVAAKVRQILIEQLKKISEIVGPSPPEEAFVLNFDFYPFWG